MIRINLLRPTEGGRTPLPPAAPRDNSAKASILSRREAVIGVFFLLAGSGTLFYLASRPEPPAAPKPKPAAEAVVHVSEPAPAPANPPAPAPAPPAVPQNCRISGASVRDQTVSIPTGRSDVKYHAFNLVNPDRIAVDLPDCRLEPSSTQSVPVDHPVVQRVRLSQFQLDPDVTRVVLDLKSAPQYQIRAVPGGLEIRLLEGRQ